MRIDISVYFTTCEVRNAIAGQQLVQIKTNRDSYWNLCWFFVFLERGINELII
jgi:hypothetical protein